MDKLDKIVTNALSTVLVTPETTTKPLIFSPQERDSIAYFFLRLDNIYGAEYRRQLPDAESERLSKREWGSDLKRYDREQVDNGITWIKNQKINHVDGWTFLDIGKCVGAIREANRHQALHQKYIAIEDNTVVTKQEGASIMANMRAGLFE